jgi:hypothetical protein
MGAPDDDPPEASSSPPSYRAYLVRLWRDGERGPWRASLTHVVTAEVRRFADPQLVWAYIQRQLEEQAKDENEAGLP